VIDFIIKRRVAHTHINISAACIASFASRNATAWSFFGSTSRARLKRNSPSPEIYFQRIFPQSSDGKRWGKTFAVCGARIIDSAHAARRGRVREQRQETNCRRKMGLAG